MLFWFQNISINYTHIYKNQNLGDIENATCNIIYSVFVIMPFGTTRILYLKLNTTLLAKRHSQTGIYMYKLWFYNNRLHTSNSWVTCNIPFVASEFVHVFLILSAFSVCKFSRLEKGS